MAGLVLTDLRKSFDGSEVIHGIDLEIRSGEFVVFVGPSGCGKSTLLRLISGLEAITSGTCAIDGEVVNDLPAAKRGLAMVFQSYALYPHMSARKNLSFGLENLGLPRREIDARVTEAARMLQIEPLLDRRPGQLSGGQRQRVAIGRAVVREPRIFLFDEPLSNLDAELRVSMRREIAQLHRRLGNTMIYVTHDQVEAMTMADKIAVLRDGRLEQFGTPLELFNQPANRFVAGFIGSPSMNFLPVTRCGTALELPSGARIEGVSAPEAAPERLELGLRPGDLRIDGGGALAMQVEEVEQLGSESYLFGTVEGVRVAVYLTGQTDLRSGDTVALASDPERMHLFCRASGTVVPLS
ncbi:ABC transporter ATP-binding protein [Litorisediminicola beolgyonensis]|uniref:ABC transporter ATP-binding protein n=1 Tax=Litorisediminicola beolgyonensis TaxID=1173614 RepID=A0ABW3ZEU4_9RHOB